MNEKPLDELNAESFDGAFVETAFSNEQAYAAVQADQDVGFDNDDCDFLRDDTSA